MEDPVIHRNYFFLLWILVTFVTDSQAFRQGSMDNVFYANFKISKFSYLNITSIGRELTQVENVCGLACLEIPSCFSYNVATFPDVNGKLLCELLPSDKFNNSDKFNASGEFHHVSITSLCDNSPCKNAGKCISLYQENGYKCICVEGFTGKNCETSTPFTSCREIYLKDKSKGNKAYSLQIGSGKIPVYCHMDNRSIGACGGGGWTMVMKIDGQKSTFHYNSTFWNNKTSFNLPGGETGFDHNETKLPTYWNLPFSQICLVMKMGQQDRSIVMNKHANSLYSVIADNRSRSTSLGRDMWKTLIGPQASLQSFCNKEGFNVVSSVNPQQSKARIGIISNQQNECNTCDSRIGFGTGGLHDDSNSCGNEATRLPDNGEKHIKTMGYILVK